MWIGDVKGGGHSSRLRMMFSALGSTNIVEDTSGWWRRLLYTDLSRYFKKVLTVKRKRTDLRSERFGTYLATAGLNDECVKSHRDVYIAQCASSIRTNETHYFGNKCRFEWGQVNVQYKKWWTRGRATTTVPTPLRDRVNSAQQFPKRKAMVHTEKKEAKKINYARFLRCTHGIVTIASYSDNYSRRSTRVTWYCFREYESNNWEWRGRQDSKRHRTHEGSPTEISAWRVLHTWQKSDPACQWCQTCQTFACLLMKTRTWK